jgi:uncharacterized small protein (DUF1192 family)
VSKEKQVTIKMNVNSAIRVLEVLDNATAGYSKEHIPERIVLLREVIEQLDKELEKVVL